jgi:putative Mg2+ transporter-C (MgtC) family protein
MDMEIILKLLLAIVWGGIVGAEREYRSKSAGFRTMIMISIGSCLFTILSFFIGGMSNPDRIAANIVTGIGFLGAGVIFRSATKVNGITTSATIWAVAAVGMGIGAGHYFASGTACILILLVLAVLPYVENFIDKQNMEREYSITCTYNSQSRAMIEEVLMKNTLKFHAVKEIKQEGSITIIWSVQGHLNNHERFILAMQSDEYIKRFEY